MTVRPAKFLTTDQRLAEGAPKRRGRPRSIEGKAPRRVPAYRCPGCRALVELEPCQICATRKA